MTDSGYIISEIVLLLIWSCALIIAILQLWAEFIFSRKHGNVGKMLWFYHRIGLIIAILSVVCAIDYNAIYGIYSFETVQIIQLHIGILFYAAGFRLIYVFTGVLYTASENVKMPRKYIWLFLIPGIIALIFIETFNIIALFSIKKRWALGVNSIIGSLMLTFLLLLVWALPYGIMKQMDRYYRSTVAESHAKELHWRARYSFRLLQWLVTSGIVPLLIAQFWRNTTTPIYKPDPEQYDFIEGEGFQSVIMFILFCIMYWHGWISMKGMFGGPERAHEEVNIPLGGEKKDIVDEQFHGSNIGAGGIAPLAKLQAADSNLSSAPAQADGDISFMSRCAYCLFAPCQRAAADSEMPADWEAALLYRQNRASDVEFFRKSDVENLDRFSVAGFDRMSLDGPRPSEVPIRPPPDRMQMKQTEKEKPLFSRVESDGPPEAAPKKAVPAVINDSKEPEKDDSMKVVVERVQTEEIVEAQKKGRFTDLQVYAKAKKDLNLKI